MAIATEHKLYTEKISGVDMLNTVTGLDGNTITYAYYPDGNVQSVRERKWGRTPF